MAPSVLSSPCRPAELWPQGWLRFPALQQLPVRLLWGKQSQQLHDSPKAIHCVWMAPHAMCAVGASCPCLSFPIPPAHSVAPAVRCDWLQLGGATAEKPPQLGQDPQGGCVWRQRRGGVDPAPSLGAIVEANLGDDRSRVSQCGLRWKGPHSPPGLAAPPQLSCPEPPPLLPRAPPWMAHPQLCAAVPVRSAAAQGSIWKANTPTHQARSSPSLLSSARTAALQPTSSSSAPHRLHQCPAMTAPQLRAAAPMSHPFPPRRAAEDVPRGPNADVM